MASTSSEDVQRKCKLTVLRVDGEKLSYKLCVTYLVDTKLHLFFRFVEDFIYAEGDEVTSRLEITHIANNGVKVVLKEHQTPKESWDAKQNREYFMSVRQLPETELG